MDTINPPLSIFDRFQFNIPPIGIKLLPTPPEDIPPINKKAALCEMIKFAQSGECFYAVAEDHTCGAGTYVLGQTGINKEFHNGRFGAGLKLFDSPRAATRIYHYVPHIDRGIADYIVFSPLQKMTFEPDILLCLAETAQTEILLRALSYSTGEMWSSKYSSAIGCAWLIAYPYLTGKLNYSITGLGHGMKRRSLFPEGRQFVAIPFDKLSTIVGNLEQMHWDLPAYRADGTIFVKNVLDSLGLE